MGVAVRMLAVHALLLFTIVFVFTCSRSVALASSVTAGAQQLVQQPASSSTLGALLACSVLLKAQSACRWHWHHFIASCWREIQSGLMKFGMMMKFAFVPSFQAINDLAAFRTRRAAALVSWCWLQRERLVRSLGRAVRAS